MRKYATIIFCLCFALYAQAADLVTLVDNADHPLRIQTLYYSGGADADGFHAAITGNSSAITTTVTGFSTPTYPAKVTVTTGGTTASVAAGDITIIGTDYAGDAQTEAIAVTENQNGVSESVGIYATVTSVAIPIQDGAGATFTIGTSSDVSAVFSPASNQLYCGYRLHGSGAFGSENLTMTFDADAGALWDVVALTSALAAATDKTAMETIPFPLHKDDVITIYCANANARNWGLEIFYRYDN